MAAGSSSTGMARKTCEQCLQLTRRLSSSTRALPSLWQFGQRIFILGLGLGLLTNSALRDASPGTATDGCPAGIVVISAALRSIFLILMVAHALFQDVTTSQSRSRENPYIGKYSTNSKSGHTRSRSGEVPQRLAWSRLRDRGPRSFNQDHRELRKPTWRRSRRPSRPLFPAAIRESGDTYRPTSGRSR